MVGRYATKVVFDIIRPRPWIAGRCDNIWWRFQGVWLGHLEMMLDVDHSHFIWRYQPTAHQIGKHAR
jgi:hypothetical protein